jgi:hypothetical protein
MEQSKGRNHLELIQGGNSLELVGKSLRMNFN